MRALAGHGLHEERFEPRDGPRRAVEMIGIRILDHVVVGDGEYASFKEAGLL